jgi:hypothetical protein
VDPRSNSSGNCCMSMYFVYLRRPRDLLDRRSDPFWEFGSFGTTGCHRKNLLNPHSTPLMRGDRLAFLQGGVHEIRVVALTPPIDVRASAELIEAAWSRRYRPIRYPDAPLLIDNSGSTEFPAVLPLLAHANRSSFCGAAGSRFRSRTKAVPESVRKQIEAWFQRQKRPTMRTYADAVCSPDSPWYQHAAMQGWTSLATRQADYADATGASRKSSRPSVSAPRRC